MDNDRAGSHGWPSMPQGSRGGRGGSSRSFSKHVIQASRDPQDRMPDTRRCSRHSSDVDVLPISQLIHGYWTGCPLCRATCIYVLKVLGSHLSPSSKCLQLWKILNTLRGIVFVSDIYAQNRWLERCEKQALLPLETFVDFRSASSPGLVVSNDVPTHLLLSYTADLARKWIASCDKYHPLCAPGSSRRSPTRLLDIGRNKNKDSIKLTVTDERSVEYNALSYCWGNAHFISSTTKTISEHIKGIPWSRLPQTFKDVILLCWELGIQYLWIDALCIIQDDSSDWERESAKMADIYSYSYITIAATAFASSNRSLFSDRWTLFPMPGNRQLKLPTGAHQFDSDVGKTFLRPSLHLAHNRFVDMENANVHATDAPLLTRAWTFQERLLPARTLHFHAEELVWECNTSMRCECSVLDQDSLKDFEAGLVDARLLKSVSKPDSWLKCLLTQIGKPDTLREEVSFAWLDFVSEYTRLNLTYETDRLPALSGLAKRFERPMLGRYLAGVWEGGLTAGLLYRAFCDDFHLVPVEQLPKAPSWSWASIPLRGENYISYSHIFMKLAHMSPSDTFSIISVHTNVVGKNPFSWVSDAVLTVRGKLCNWKVMPSVRDEVWFLRMLAQDDVVVGDHGTRLLLKGAKFYPDGRMRLERGIMLSCLLVGSAEKIAYGLVLRNLNGDTYRRVGLFEYDGLSVFGGVAMAEISIV